MLHLAMKAFYPSKPPFPLLHVDTTWKFREMIAVPRRDRQAARPQADRAYQRGRREARHQSVRFRLGAAHPGDEDREPEAGARQVRLRRGLRRRAARRGKVPRQGAHLLVPHAPRMPGIPRTSGPNSGASTTRASTRARSIRVFPLSNWTELDIWQYILAENIPIVPLYFAKKRPVVERDGTLIMGDDERMKLHARREGGGAAGALPHPGLLSADRRDRDATPTRWKTSSREMLTARTSRAPGPADRQRRKGLDGEEEEGGVFLMTARLRAHSNFWPRRKRSRCCAFSPAAASTTASPP